MTKLQIERIKQLTAEVKALRKVEVKYRHLIQAYAKLSKSNKEPKL